MRSALRIEVRYRPAFFSAWQPFPFTCLFQLVGSGLYCILHSTQVLITKTDLFMRISSIFCNVWTLDDSHQLKCCDLQMLHYVTQGFFLIMDECFCLVWRLLGQVFLLKEWLFHTKWYDNNDYFLILMGNHQTKFKEQNKKQNNIVSYF